jgi:signal peptidase
MRKEKRNRIINLTVNIIVAVILVFVFIITINILASKDKGYVNLFGTASIAVETDSMNPDGTLGKTYTAEHGFAVKGFAKGDLIYVKVLKDDAKAGLAVGDVITYYYDVDGDGVTELNTHRIVSVLTNTDGTISYRTHGDNNPEAMTEVIDSRDVIGIYSGRKAGGLGNVSLFFHTSTGFLVCVVVPAFLILAYCVFLLVKSILDKRRLEMRTELEAAKAAAGASTLSEEEKEKIRDEERERIRKELLADNKSGDKPAGTDTPKE